MNALYSLPVVSMCECLVIRTYGKARPIKARVFGSESMIFMDL